MKQFKYRVLISVFMLCTMKSALVTAANTALKVQLTLESIEQLKPNSSNGDDLYFALTEYSNQKRPSLIFIPPKPNHWRAAQLPKVKQLKLWERSLAPNEAVELVISLADQSIAPWSIDDDLGTFKFFVVNAEAEPALKFLWGIPNQNEVVKEKEEKGQTTLLLKGGDGLYRLIFSIK